MPVLTEGTSVVIRADRLIEKFPGGWDEFKKGVPNKTLCADNELVRVGFMVADDVEHFVHMLTDNGLTYLEDGVAQDLIVVDQIKGPMAYCEWVEFRFGNLDDDPKKRVAGCRLKDGEQTELATPEGWEYEESLSASYMFTPTEHVEKGLTFLRREDGLDVYRSETTGKEVYMGRSYGDDDEP